LNGRHNDSYKAKTPIYGHIAARAPESADQQAVAISWSYFLLVGGSARLECGQFRFGAETWLRVCSSILRDCEKLILPSGPLGCVMGGESIGSEYSGKGADLVLCDE
jgi:hypothetical protein